MTVFQVLTVPIAVVLAAFSLRGVIRGERPRLIRFVRFLVFATAAIAIWDPNLTNRVAQALGIGRGADLLIYVVAITVIVGFFYFYQTTRRLEREITGLVRDIALERAARSASRTPEETTEG